MKHLIKKKLKQGSYFKSVVVIFLLLVMIAMIIFQVLVRKLSTNPPLWTLEAILWLWLFIAFIGFIEVEERKTHMEISLLLNYLSDRTKIIIDFAWLFIYTALFVFLTYLTIFKTVLKITDAMDSEIGLPIIYLYIPISLAFVYVLFLNLLRLYKAFKKIIHIKDI